MMHPQVTARSHPVYLPRDAQVGVGRDGTGIFIVSVVERDSVYEAGEGLEIVAADVNWVPVKLIGPPG